MRKKLSGLLYFLLLFIFSYTNLFFLPLLLPLFLSFLHSCLFIHFPPFLFFCFNPSYSLFLLSSFHRFYFFLLAIPSLNTSILFSLSLFLSFPSSFFIHHTYPFLLSFLRFYFYPSCSYSLFFLFYFFNFSFSLSKHYLILLLSFHLFFSSFFIALSSYLSFFYLFPVFF